MTVEEFEEFYAQTVARLTGQLYVMLGDQHEAQDVVQEAFAKGWSRMGVSSTGTVSPRRGSARSPGAWR